MDSRSLKILLLGGSCFPFGSRRYLRYHRLFGGYFPALAPHVLAKVTPAQHQVTISDIKHVKPSADFDLVGMSFTTPMARDANELSEKFRALGVPTIAGGVHASLNLANARLHFDSVVRGPGEVVWPKILDDFTAGRMRKIYFGVQPDNIPFVGKINSGSLIKTDPIEITRGCPIFCGDFCTVPSYYGPRTYLTRPVDKVIEEMGQLGRNLLLYDNNLVSKPDYAKELFRKMVRLRKRWLGAASLQAFVDDPSLAGLLYQSGCAIIFLGLETLSEGYFRNGKKKINEYETGIKILHDAGVGVETSFIVGLPHDTRASLEEIPSFVWRNHVEAVSVNMATPFPGTGFFKRLQQEGRILTYDWSKYDTERVVFRPYNMEPEELQDCYDDLIRDIFSLDSIIYRGLTGETDTFPTMAVNILNRASFELGQGARLLNIVN